ncbi:MAG: DUF255 domain-containing protein [Flavobacteriales bacterium]|nr:DUF255 domain-containing protein [Flavobacteriales bacterium]
MKKLGVFGAIMLVLCAALVAISSFTAIVDELKKPQIKWMTMQEAVDANKTVPKKIFFDVYTDWCGWCKRMDATTFQHAQIVEYMNKNFYAVKFNAESNEEITINGKKYTKKNRTHEFAIEMLQGKLSYPSFAIYDESQSNIGVVQGFKAAQDLEIILNYFGTNTYKKQSWSEFNKNFKGYIQ